MMLNIEYLRSYQAITGKGNTELANDFGVTQGGMSLWLSGDRETPHWVVRVIKLIYAGKLKMEDWRGGYE